MQANIPHISKKRVVIVGGGFGGLKLATELMKSDFQVVLVDRNNYHQFQPLFYQVATAGLEPSSIAFPFRKIFQKHKDFHFRMAELIEVDPIQKTIETSIGSIEFNYLVIATGVETNFFGNQRIAQYALPMKSVHEALSLRNVFFKRMEEAISAETNEELEKLLNLVIVGGGPTGVEVAGTLAEMRKYILPKDYPEMDFSKMKIFLVEGSSRVLNAMSEQSSIKAAQYLKELGVEVFANCIVEDYNGEKVQLKNGNYLHSKNLIWAAGVAGTRIKGLHEDSNAPGGRIFVNQYNQIAGSTSVFAIGDIACMVSEKYPKGHPQMAQPAIQEGKNLAKNLRRLQQNLPLNSFHYKNMGSMATVGRNKAVVELPNYKFAGFFAWFVWMVVHLKSILGIKNKFMVFLNWVWNYITYNLSLRLIIQHKEKPQ